MWWRLFTNFKEESSLCATFYEKEMSYKDKCHAPIPIGKQKFAYQCENVSFEPVAGKINIRAWIPSGRGKEPYPNEEQDKVAYYNLEIGRFTANAIEIIFTKRFKDGAEETYLRNVSFAQLVNEIFLDHPANIWINEAPVNQHP